MLSSFRLQPAHDVKSQASGEEEEGDAEKEDLKPGALKVSRQNIVKSVGGGGPSVAGSGVLSGAGEVVPPRHTIP
jgi:hypothetical protein